MTHFLRFSRLAAPCAALLAAAVCAVPAALQAQPPPEKPATSPKTDTAPPAAKDPQSSFEPRSGPGKGQALMEKMTGNWNVVKSIFPVGKPPVRTRGTCRQNMVNGGRFLHSQFSFANPTTGAEESGVGVLGYDPQTDQFTSVWIDERSTAFSFRQSETPFDGEQVILVGKSLDPAGAPARKSRSVARLENNGDLLLHQQFVPTDTGGERVVMELKMTRIKDKPKTSETKPAAVKPIPAKPTAK